MSGYNWLEGKSIVFLGDSVTAESRSNYISLFLNRLSQEIDASKVGVINSGVDSNTVLDVIDRVPDVVDEYNPDIVSIFVGINDSKIFHYIKRPLLSPELFTESYQSLIDRINVTRKRVFLLITPPRLLFEEINESNYLDDYWYWIPSEYEKYVQGIRYIATSNNYLLADAYTAFINDRSNKRLFYDDGVHPNIYGHQLIAKEIANALFRK